MLGPEKPSTAKTSNISASNEKPLNILISFSEVFATTMRRKNKKTEAEGSKVLISPFLSEAYT